MSICVTTLPLLKSNFCPENMWKRRWALLQCSLICHDLLVHTWAVLINTMTCLFSQASELCPKTSVHHLQTQLWETWPCTHLTLPLVFFVFFFFFFFFMHCKWRAFTSRRPATSPSKNQQRSAVQVYFQLVSWIYSFEKLMGSHYMLKDFIQVRHDL